MFHRDLNEILFKCCSLQRFDLIFNFPKWLYTFILFLGFFDRLVIIFFKLNFLLGLIFPAIGWTRVNFNIVKDWRLFDVGQIKVHGWLLLNLKCAAEHWKLFVAFCIWNLFGKRFYFTFRKRHITSSFAHWNIASFFKVKWQSHGCIWKWWFVILLRLAERAVVEYSILAVMHLLGCQSASIKISLDFRFIYDGISFKSPITQERL